jgi:hypothetical protein
VGRRITVLRRLLDDGGVRRLELAFSGFNDGNLPSIVFPLSTTNRGGIETTPAALSMQARLLSSADMSPQAS